MLTSCLVLILCLIHIRGQLDTCIGCRSGIRDNGMDCYGMTSDDSIYACRGTFFGGMNATGNISAEYICNDGYHVCKSARETTILGLTYSSCNTIININEIYFSLESSAGEWQCESNGYNSGFNDIWGCTNNATRIFTSDIESTVRPCIQYPYDYNELCGNTLNIACGNHNLNGIFGGLDIDGQEWLNIEFYNATFGGVLCCKDTSGIPINEGDNYNLIVLICIILPIIVIFTYIYTRCQNCENEYELNVEAVEAVEDDGNDEDLADDEVDDVKIADDEDVEDVSDDKNDAVDDDKQNKNDAVDDNKNDDVDDDKETYENDEHDASHASDQSELSYSVTESKSQTPSRYADDIYDLLWKVMIHVQVSSDSNDNSDSNKGVKSYTAYHKARYEYTKKHANDEE